MLAKIRDYHRMHIKISPIIYDLLKECADATGYTMNTLVCAGLYAYLFALEDELIKKGKLKYEVSKIQKQQNLQG